jgi:hypothetical protein
MRRLIRALPPNNQCSIEPQDRLHPIANRYAITLRLVWNRRATPFKGGAGWGVREGTMMVAFGDAGLAQTDGTVVSILFGAV